MVNDLPLIFVFSVYQFLHIALTYDKDIKTTYTSGISAAKTTPSIYRVSRFQML